MDVAFCKQAGDALVDVLLAIIGVEAVDFEGECLDEGLEDREQEAFGDALDGADELELGDLPTRLMW